MGFNSQFQSLLWVFTVVWSDLSRVCSLLFVRECTAMASQTRRMAFPKVVIERDSDTEQSSSDDEGQAEEEEGPLSESESEEEDVKENLVEEKSKEKCDEKKKGKATITISLKKVCKVSVFPFLC